MSEGQGTLDGVQGQGPADAGQGGQGPADAGQGAGASDGATRSGSDDRDAVIARLNAEAKDWRTKYEGAQSKLTEIEQGQLSDLERAQTQAAEAEQRAIVAETQAQTLRVSMAVEKAAVSARAVDPALVANIIDPSRVEFGSDGTPTNLTALIDEVKKAHPILFGSGLGSADGGARGGTPTGDMNELIRRAASRSA